MRNQTNSFVLIEDFNIFLKKAVHATLSFLLCIDRCEMKNVQLFLLFSVGDSCLLSLGMLT